jgi:hypothetical protein
LAIACIHLKASSIITHTPTNQPTNGQTDSVAEALRPARTLERTFSDDNARNTIIHDEVTKSICSLLGIRNTMVYHDESSRHDNGGFVLCSF